MRRPTVRVKSGRRLGPNTINIIANMIMSSGKPILNIKDILSEIEKCDNTNPISIYIHIPFCKSKCVYCDFNSYAIEPYEEYFDAISNEIESFGKIIKRKIKSIYFGGGTPSVIEPVIIEKILNQIYKYFNVVKNLEITIEVNPESITFDRAKKYRAYGINRISAGIQSFNEKFLRILGRAGTAGDNIKLFKILDSAGFENVSADLMFGLPEQNPNDWIGDLKKLVQYEPAHISAYMLTPPEGMEGAKLPSEEIIRKMLFNCIEFLEAKGWSQYEISNYARKGYECRHNLNYWNYGEYLGLGAGAHSFFKTSINGNSGIRWWNISLPKNFSTATERIQNFEYITPEIALKEFIMLGLRKREGIKLTDLTQFRSINMDKLIMHLEQLISGGVLSCEENRIKLTIEGIAVSNEIISMVWRGVEILA